MFVVCPEITSNKRGYRRRHKGNSLHHYSQICTKPGGCSRISPGGDRSARTMLADDGGVDGDGVPSFFAGQKDEWDSARPFERAKGGNGQA